jgi:hypothetical protein
MPILADGGKAKDDSKRVLMRLIRYDDSTDIYPRSLANDDENTTDDIIVRVTIIISQTAWVDIRRIIVAE